MSDDGSSLATETVKSTIGKVLMAVTRFGTAIVFAQHLGPAIFGATYLLVRVGNVACQVVVGWGDAAKKRLSEPDAPSPSVVGGVLLVAAIWGFVFFVASAMITRWFVDAAVVARPGLYLGGFVAVESLAYAIDKLLEGKGRVGAASLSRAGRFVVAVPVQLWLLANGYGGASILAGYIFGAAIVSVIAFASLGVRPSFPSRPVFRSQWSFGRYAVPNALLGTLYGSLDLLLLTALVSTTAAGWYEAAWTVTMPAVFVAAAAASKLMVDVSADRDGIAESVSLTLAYASIIAVPLLFGSVVIAPQLVSVVFGPEYSSAAPFVVGLALFQLVRTKVAPLLQVTYGLGHPSAVTRITLSTVAVNLVAGVLLTVAVGPIGVVAATVVAELVRVSWLARFVRTELTGVEFFARPFRNQVVSGGVMLVVLVALRTIIAPESLGSLVGFVVVGGGVYAFAMAVLDTRASMVACRTLSAIRRLLSSGNSLLQ